MPSCPRCRIPLHTGSAAGEPVHGCARCGGVWLGKRGAERLTTALCADTLALADTIARYAPERVDTTVPHLACPECARPMARRLVERARVELDDCPAHGTWFDRDELGVVARSLAAARAYGAPSGSRHGAHLAAAVGGVAAGATAVAVGAALADPATQQRARTTFDVVADDVAVDAVDVIDGIGVTAEIASSGLGLAGDLAAGGLDAAGSGVEVAGAVLEGGSGILEGVFGLLGALFEGLSS